jgi:hypothetical protein
VVRDGVRACPWPGPVRVDRRFGGVWGLNAVRGLAVSMVPVMCGRHVLWCAGPSLRPGSGFGVRWGMELSGWAKR